MIFPVSADTAHASAGAARLFDEYFTAKSAHDLPAWMAMFEAGGVCYCDATLGWVFPDFDALRGVLEQNVPHWADGISYATRILGDETSAVIFVTDTPQLFGSEIRSISTADMVDGKIVRFVDYWDARHFGAAAASSMRTPDEHFPVELGEKDIAERAATALQDTSRALAAALANGAPDEASRLFTDDAVLEDMTLHTQVLGRLAVRRYLDRAGQMLPWSGQTDVVHVVGSAAGGGYEWRAPSRTVTAGIVALELDPAGLIGRLTTVWDGSRVPDDALNRLMLLAREDGST